jgi:hypothetical protein
MTALERKFHLRRAALKSLDDCGSYPCLASALRTSIEIKADYLTPTVAELDEVLRTIQSDQLATALPSERGHKFTLTDAGRHWLAQNP